MFLLRTALAFAVGLAGPSAPSGWTGLRAQSAQRLGAADAVAPEPFALIRGVREVPDGRLLVSDWIEERVLLVDARLSSAAAVGRIEAVAAIRVATMRADQSPRRTPGLPIVPFAPKLPYFDPAGVFLAPDGEVSVLRGRHAGSPPVYDRFDRQGERVGRITMDTGRAVAALGRRHVYVVATDADGLQTLERYPRPAARP